MVGLPPWQLRAQKEGILVSKAELHGILWLCPGLRTFSVKGQDSKYFRLEGHLVSLVTTVEFVGGH